MQLPPVSHFFPAPAETSLPLLPSLPSPTGARAALPRGAHVRDGLAPSSGPPHPTAPSREQNAPHQRAPRILLPPLSPGARFGILLPPWHAVLIPCCSGKLFQRRTNSTRTTPMLQPSPGQGARHVRGNVPLAARCPAACLLLNHQRTRPVCLFTAIFISSDEAALPQGPRRGRVGWRAAGRGRIPGTCLRGCAPQPVPAARGSFWGPPDLVFLPLPRSRHLCWGHHSVREHPLRPRDFLSAEMPARGPCWGSAPWSCHHRPARAWSPKELRKHGELLLAPSRGWRELAGMQTRGKQSAGLRRALPLPWHSAGNPVCLSHSSFSPSPSRKRSKHLINNLRPTSLAFAPVFAVLEVSRAEPNLTELLNLDAAG